MVRKIMTLALIGTVAFWSIGCQPETTRTTEEPGSPPAQRESGSPPDAKAEPGSPADAKGEPGSPPDQTRDQREPGS